MTESTRFSVTYLINESSEKRAAENAEKLCIEQTAELPIDVIPEKIKRNWTGSVTNLKKESNNKYKAIVSYPLNTTGFEVAQTLNLLFGNSSLQAGVQIVDTEWDKLTAIFNGPRFGIDGIRRKLNIAGRPISCTALKPMGLNFAEFADLSFHFARGGIDIIKDDHGLANQNEAPFIERIKAVVGAIRKASDETGKEVAYFPNITADGIGTWRRYEIAAELGADGVLVCPQLTGLPTLHTLAGNNPALPIIAHPSFSGSYVIHPDHGFAPEFYYGYLWRALGADAVIYPNVHGRFSFTEETCFKINQYARNNKLPFKPTLPVPAGGMKLNTVDEFIEKYGPDTIYLIAGNLYQHPAGIETGTHEFQQKIEYNG